MANLVEANNIAGLKVYGQQQVDYTVEGKAGCDFGLAVARASMLRSVAVEGVLTGLTSAVRKREQKLTDLGQALAYIAEAAAEFNKDSHTDDTASSTELATAAELLDKYDIPHSAIKTKTLPGVPPAQDVTIGTITQADVQKLQTNVQYALDKEDNYLQQDLVSVQSYFSKRDQALSMAASLVKKVNNTMTSGIRAIN
jgi:hypothetical protein